MAANIGGYISIGTNNLEAAREFYDSLFEPMGVKGFRGNDRSYFYRFKESYTYFAVFIPLLTRYPAPARAAPLRAKPAIAGRASSIFSSVLSPCAF